MAWEDELEATIVRLLEVADALASKAVEEGSALSAESADRLLASAALALDAAGQAAEAVPALVELKRLGLTDEPDEAPPLRSLVAGEAVPRLQHGSRRLLRRSALMRARLSMASTGRELLAHAGDDDGASS